MEDGQEWREMTATYSCRVKSVAKLRERWATEAKRSKLHRDLAWGNCSHFHPWLKKEGDALVVTLTRIAPGALSGDNLQSALQATRNGVTEWLDVDDSDGRITWTYAQEKGAPKYYGVRITIDRIQGGA